MSLHIRTTTSADLNEINHIIEAAIMTWDLAERVIRLTLPTYKYNDMDLQHMQIVVAIRDNIIVGVAAWEQAESVDTPNNQSALTLHGIYVEPRQHRQGIGSMLFNAAEQAAEQQNLGGIIVKAQKGSETFYQSRGMHKLEVTDKKYEFKNRYYLNIHNGNHRSV